MIHRKFSNFSIQTVTALPRFSDSDKIDPSTDLLQLLPNPGSMSLYINIPYCRTICRFCMLRKAAKINESVPNEFIDLLINEISSRSQSFKSNDITSIYFGGGTPSLLNSRQVDRILDTIYKEYRVHSKVEISIEGEAKSFNRIDFLKGLKSLGVNRISFGLQTMNQAMREFLGRTDTIDDVVSLKRKLDNVCFDDINVDYLYNLPGTTPKFVESDIKDVIDLQFDSIDCHPLKYISCSSKLLRDIYDQEISIPSATDRIKMYKIMRESIFNLAKMDEQLVDQYTSTNPNSTNLYILHLNGLNSGQYAGFGPGSRSHYGDYGMVNERTIHGYSNSITQIGNSVNVLCKSFQVDNYITRLPKRNDKITSAIIKDSNYASFYFNVFDTLIDLGYIEIDKNAYLMTQEGLNWYQNIQEVLLVPEQRERHIISTKERAEKLAKFGNYFDVIGKDLRNVNYSKT